MRVWKPLTTRWNYVVIDVDKDMGGYKLTNLGGIATANLLLKEGTPNEFWVRNVGDTGYQILRAERLYPQTMIWYGTLYGEFRAAGYNNSSVTIMGVDTGVGHAEVARIVGAPTAYLNLVGGRSCLDHVDLRKCMLIWSLIG